MAHSEQISIRKATRSDAARLAEIHTISRRESLAFLPHLHSDEETVRWMTDVVLPNQQVWLAVAGGEIAAFIALLGNAVEHLYVMPEHQRRGIGDRLLALAKEHSSGELRLHCFQKNANGRAFYEARGFAAIAFSDGSNNEEHEPDILYRWTAR